MGTHNFTQLEGICKTINHLFNKHSFLRKLDFVCFLLILMAIVRVRPPGPTLVCNQMTKKQNKCVVFSDKKWPDCVALVTKSAVTHVSCVNFCSRPLTHFHFYMIVLHVIHKRDH